MNAWYAWEPRGNWQICSFEQLDGNYVIYLKYKDDQCSYHDCEQEGVSDNIRKWIYFEIIK